MEEWKDVPNYEGLYQVSTLGNVKSLERIKNSKGADFVDPERILRPCTTTHGYSQVILCKDKTKKPFSIHKLVAITFLNYTPEKKLSIDHINENKKDNRLENLQILPIRLNRIKSSNPKSGYIGVYKYQKGDKYYSTIQKDGVKYKLGSFNSAKEAHEAYLNKAKELYGDEYI